MGAPLRLLAVEDVEQDALLVVRELTRGGYDVTFERVDTPEAMAAALRKQPWDVVISDYSMPRFSAPLALGVMKELNLDLPFIIVSGTIGEEVAVDAIRAGAHDFMVKGKLARLVPAVERELREVEARRRLGRTERALLASEERLESVLRSVPDVLFSVSPNFSDVQYVSPAATQVTGFAPGEFVEDPGLWRRQVRPDDGKVIEAALRRARAGEVVSDEFRMLRRDGTERWINMTLVPVRNPQGEVRRLDGIARDITEKRRLEQQLQQAQKMESVGRLAGGVAHDFNNQLCVIIGWTEIAMGDLPAGHASREALEAVLKAGHGAAEVTGRLLAFARQQVVQPTLFNINDLVLEMDKMIRPLIGEDIQLRTRPDPELGTVKMDRGLLEQVLLNLVVNARDAMPDGGTLTIATANVTLDGAYQQKAVDVTPGDYVMLLVSDSGSGMSEDVKAHLFEPFHTTKPVGKGTGLGLATCYGIVKQAGGHIAAYSEVGIGTTMKVFLPRRHEAAVAATRRPSVPSVRGVETILLVEDEETVRRVTARILEALGYSVVITGSGEEALRVIEEGRHALDLLLTDVVLAAGMNGRVLAERARTLKPNLKVLYASGYTSDVAVLHALVEQDAVLLGKPFTVESLGSKVRQVLDAK